MANEELHSKAALASRAVYDEALAKAHDEGYAQGKAEGDSEIATLKGTLESFQKQNEVQAQQLVEAQDNLAATHSALLVSRADVTHLNAEIERLKNPEKKEA